MQGWLAMLPDAEDMAPTRQPAFPAAATESTPGSATPLGP